MPGNRLQTTAPAPGSLSGACERSGAIRGTAAPEVFGYFPPSACTGKDGYPPEWHATIKHVVRDQAGNRCVRCGHPYERGAGEWSPCDERCTHRGPLRVAAHVGHGLDRSGIIEPDVTAGAYAASGPTWAHWRILTVHHLDGDKGNCRWWNLAALCQRDHLEIQCKVHMDRRWLKPHSEWFQPYVAGYYAFTLLGEDLSREQVEARLDELLGLEDRQLSLTEDGA
jgi:hypothetical protein